MQTWISHDFKQVSCTVMSSSQSDQMETDLCLQTVGEHCAVTFLSLGVGTCMRYSQPSYSC